METSFLNIEARTITKVEEILIKMKTPITKIKAPLEIALSRRNHFQKIEASFSKLKAPFINLKWAQ